MKKPHLTIATAVLAVLTAFSVPLTAEARTPIAAHVHASAVKQVSALQLLGLLKVTPETRASSYQRGKFKTWIDADHDGENTRAEVLKAESLKPVTKNAAHTITTGKWLSRYDGKTYTVASKLDIDHLVPLEEAWTSGAASWTAAKREAYANDLGYSADLIAVSLHANRSKGDKSPDAYLPPKRSYDCTYVRNWIAVKYRWHLTIDTPEKKALTKDLHTLCTSLQVAKPPTPNIAKLDGTTTTHTKHPTPKHTPTPRPTVTTTPAPTPTAVPTATPTDTPTSSPTTTPSPTATPTDSTPGDEGTVTPGAFCSPAGATGHTDRGTAMICRTSATDSRLRWRSA